MTEGTPGTAAQVRQLFDAKAATWSEKYAAGGRLTGRLAHLADAAQAQVSAGCAVLDLGCGTGDLARHLAQGGIKVTGCDISGEMLKRATQADAMGAVEWVRLDPDWQALPFADKTFGEIVASSVLEYVDDPVPVLRECARVLQPGGTLLCTVPDLRHPVRWLEWLASFLARPTLINVLARRLPAVQGYLSYLRTSRQRRSAQQWQIIAARVGLRHVPALSNYAIPQPLRLLTLRRPGEARRFP